MLYSSNLLRKRLDVEPSLSNLKTSEMNSKCRSKKKELDKLREKRCKRDSDKSKSYKPPKTTNSNSRLRNWLKKRGWKTNSKRRWLRSSLRTSV